MIAPGTNRFYMNPRKNIIRMLLVALGVMVVCCVLLSLSGCTGCDANTGKLILR